MESTRKSAQSATKGLRGLRHLKSLQRLNLSANFLTNLSDVQFLTSLVDLDVSYNNLEGLPELRRLHGPQSALTKLNVAGNCISFIDSFIKDLSGLCALTDLHLTDGSASGNENPLCGIYGFRALIFTGLPQLQLIDGQSRSSTLQNFAAEHFAPRKDLSTLQNNSTGMISFYKERDSNVSPTVRNSATQTESPTLSICKQEPLSLRSKRKTSTTQTFSPADARRYFRKQQTGRPQRPELLLGTVQTKSDKGKLLQDPDLQAALQQQAEDVYKQLTERIISLEARGAEEVRLIGLVSSLRQELRNEQKCKALLETHIRKIIINLTSANERFKDLFAAFSGYNCLVFSGFSALEDRLMAGESEWASQLLASERECREAVRKISLLEERFLKLHHNRGTERDSRVAEVSKKYAMLEDEFRSALQSETIRYDQLFERTKLAEEKASRRQTELEDADRNLKCAKDLLMRLNTDLKELKLTLHQERKKSGVSASIHKQETLTLKAQLQAQGVKIKSLEETLNESSKLRLEIRSLKEKVACLNSENIGLKEAQNRESSLRRDQEAMSAKIAEFSEQLPNLQAELDSARETVRVKTKIIDDQTDTIRTLKKELSEAREESKRVENEMRASRKKLEVQMTDCASENGTLREQVEKLLRRKDDLKDTIVDLRSSLEIVNEEKKKLETAMVERERQLDNMNDKLSEFEEFWKSKVVGLERQLERATLKVRELSTALHTSEQRYARHRAENEEALSAAAAMADVRVKQVEEASQSRILQLEGEMRQILQESAESKRKVEATLRSLAGSVSNMPGFLELKPGRKIQKAVVSCWCLFLTRTPIAATGF
ncbi:leucine rich repeat [Sparganum proliferum]